MSWRINKIKIRNFKFFRKEFLIETNGRNVLLYGENGAGKSSIAWSVYTHFQAVFKTPGQAGKYFDPTHKENLRNRFSDPADESSIEIEFIDENKTKKSFADSLSACYISSPDAKAFMDATAFASDFLNYKFLSSLFDFDNSQKNEVFPLFNKHIFPFLTLDESRKLQDGTLTEDSNISSWLKWLKETLTTLPRGRRRTHTISKDSDDFKHYDRELQRFNRLLDKELKEIIEGANLSLKNEFRFPVEIHYGFTPASIQRTEGGKFHDPSILLNAKMTDPNLSDTSLIEHPKSFFNEAKITAMALAIRMAALNRRATLRNGAGVLFIDDMLISLDMSLRRLVLPMLLKYARTHQVFLLTHDRSVFNMVREMVLRNEDRKDAEGKRADFGKWKEDWQAFELFAKDTPDGPEPFFVTSKSYLDRARGHLFAFRVPECANALRQCCEAELKRLLSSHHKYATDRETGELTDPTLANYIAKFEKERDNKKFPDIFPSIDSDRQRILNPFSHDDIETPYYMGELRLALDTMEELCKVERKVPIPLEWVGDKNKAFSFNMEVVTDAGVSHTAAAVFYFLENFDLWEYKGQLYPGNPKVRVLSVGGSVEKKLRGLTGKDNTLKKLYYATHHSLSIKKDVAPPVHTEIINHSTGSLLEI